MPDGKNNGNEKDNMQRSIIYTPVKIPKVTGY
jgi:hypothetical protein